MDLRGNARNAKEKVARKTCFSREKSAWLHASTRQNFAWWQFFKVNGIIIIFSWEKDIKTGESIWKGLITKGL